MNKYGLLGKKLSHSFSEKYFTKKFDEQKYNAVFGNYEMDDISSIRNVISDNNINGMSVTIPYKLDIIPLIDSLDDTAKEIGAVNVIKVVNTNGSIKIKGFNTDYLGFKSSLESFDNLPTKALVLGSGGASKAICYALKLMNIDYKIVSRTKSDNTILYSDLDKHIMTTHKLIINTTPLGTSPNVTECANIPYQMIGDGHLLFDLVYNPELTQFLANGKKQGARYVNGYQMLCNQADAALNIWQS